MTCHVYYIDRFGEPFIKVQMDTEEKAVETVRRYADDGGKRHLEEAARFAVNDGGTTVVILRDALCTK